MFKTDLPINYSNYILNHEVEQKKVNLIIFKCRSIGSTNVGLEAELPHVIHDSEN